jgi:DNA adenine methylase
VSAPKRPALRYHGGKWKIAPWIIGHFPKHRVYVEPFGGGASVLLRKPRSYAEVYNDLDGEIVNFFRVLRDRGGELKQMLELTPYARDEFDLAYAPSDDPLEQARRTIIRAGMGFGSSGTSSLFKTGFRGSVTRSGTHPAMDWANRIATIDEVVSRFQSVVIENRPAVDVMTYHDAETTLHYVDPPYVHSERIWKRDGSKDAYRHEMTDDDHRKLAGCLHDLAGFVIVSGYPSGLYDELFEGWHRVSRETFADGAKARTECLWLSPRTVQAIQQDLFTGEVAS